MKQKTYLFLGALYVLSLVAHEPHTYHGGYAVTYTDETAQLGSQLGQILKEITDNAIFQNDGHHAQYSRKSELKDFFIFLGKPSNSQIPIICQYNQTTNRWDPGCGISSEAFKRLKETDVPLNISRDIVDALQAKKLLTDYIDSMYLPSYQNVQGDEYIKAHFANKCIQEAEAFLKHQNQQKLHILFLRLATFLDRDHLAKLFSTIDDRFTQEDFLHKWGIAMTK